MKTLRIFISGTVQGVMFRKFIEDEANKIGVRGFVRNTEDGGCNCIRDRPIIYLNAAVIDAFTFKRVCSE